MMKKLAIHPFAIAAANVQAEDKNFLESVFSQGNGYMGVRGFDPVGEKQNGHERSVFLAGVFEYIKHGITDMVNTPDIFCTRLMMPGARESRAGLHLDMHTGLWTRTAEYVLPGGQRFSLVTRRVLSMDNVHAAALQLAITPLDEALDVCLETGIDGDVCNLPISDDQMSQNVQVHRLLHPAACTADEQGGALEMESKPSCRRISQAFGVKNSLRFQQTGVVGQGYTAVAVSGRIPKGETLLVEKCVVTYTYRDGEQDAPASARKLLQALSAMGFEGVFEKSAKAFALLWEDCDIELDAGGDLQGAIRYNIFQLLQNNAAHDPRAGIGARGLMHGRYKGNYFWDTELFMLPFYQYARPEAARNLLLYRYHTLPDAVEGAKQFGLRGARYPWMCSDTGYEQCETWDTGCCEVHITADVAFAVMDYWQTTGDEDFLVNHGAQMLLQTARYWVSRLSYDAAHDVYNMLFVKGPDEYCGVTVNNTYTNVLVQENLKGAALAAETLRQKHPEHYARLMEKTGMGEAEWRAFETVAEKVAVLYDPQRDLYLEDAHFEQLEPLDISSHKKGYAALYRTMSYDRLQRYKVLKQADLVLLMTLLPGRFSPAQQRKVWEYYEPLTLHDSTLSFGTHAQLAARLGLTREAMEYLKKSAYLDLDNLMDNTQNEGVHMAAFGATWQALVLGMAGLKKGEGGKPAFSPSFPREIRGMRFSFYMNGEKYTAHIQRKGAAYAITSCIAAAGAVE